MIEGWFRSRMRHPRDPRHPLREVAWVVAQRALEGVRLDVGLVDDVEPELVGQIEKDGVVRVMRGPNRVEPEPLHEHEVSAHRLGRDDPSRVLVEIVAVDAADEDPPAVHEEIEAPDLDTAKSHLDDRPLDHLAGRRVEADLQRVAGRRLRAPRCDAGDAEVEGDAADGRRDLAAVGRAPRVEVVGDGGRAPDDPSPGDGLERPGGRRRSLARSADGGQEAGDRRLDDPARTGFGAFEADVDRKGKVNP